MKKTVTKTAYTGRTKAAMSIFWLLLLAAIWELAALSGAVSPLIMPRLGDIFRALFRDLVHGHLLWQTLLSLLMIAGAMAVSLVLAVLLTLLTRTGLPARSFVETLLRLAHPLPGLAVMPVIILWFGAGTRAVFVVLIHSALWPLLLAMMTGTDETPDIYTNIGRSLALGPLRSFFEIRLRYAAPHIVSGIRIAWARSWRALISAEMVFGAIGIYGGIGSYIMGRRTFMDTPGLFAGIIMVIAAGYAVEKLFFVIMRRIDRAGRASASAVKAADGGKNELF